MPIRHRDQYLSAENSIGSLTDICKDMSLSCAVSSNTARPGGELNASHTQVNSDKTDLSEAVRQTDHLQAQTITRRDCIETES